MKKRTTRLSGFAVLSLLTAFGVLDVCGCTGFNPEAAVETAAQTQQAPAADSRVIAYYFHGTTRCNTCRTIEAYALEAVQRGFGDALKAGKIEWRPLNVEEPANRHFIKDYQLYTRSVVLASYQGDKQLRWKNLDKVWELVGDKGQFTRYVQGEVKTFLESR
ncbi:MAG: hypothetical protein EHM18_00975 [Acidobacteria bacterium]|nr:MAG: hypothetical protein EHM18_00975 [Acidobacteriota bacterium]